MAIDYALFAKMSSQGVPPTLINLGAGAVGMSVPQFDSLTGKPMAASVQIGNLEEIDGHIAQINANLANVQMTRNAAAQALSKP